MHFHSPRAYNFFRETFNKRLPHSKTIQSWYANSDLDTQPNIINDHCLGILKRTADEYAQCGRKLVCSLLFDEMHIMKHVQWSNREHKLVGYANTIEKADHAPEHLNVANQALVFMVNALNADFQLPIVYYFIKSMNGEERQMIVEKIIKLLMGCNIIISNIVFDGFQPNKTMCRLLGADLKVDSPTFKPYFEIEGKQIFILFDACHMLKLLRNQFATKKILVDSVGNEIKWEYVERLVNMKNSGFEMTHKMNRSHISWSQKKMKVCIAAQTLSESTASSMEFLMRKGIAEFAGSEFTTEFIRLCDRLFSIFNSKSDQNENMFKRSLSCENANEIFIFFDYATKYLKGLQMKTDDGSLVRVCSSIINTGFNGFIINMESLKLLYRDLVETNECMEAIRTYCLQQDPIEIFFGKVRSLGGYNDNPTCEQFSAAFRKLLAYSTVMYSKFSNCQSLENSRSDPYSNILSITSRRHTKTNINLRDHSEVCPEEIDELYEKLREIKEFERSIGLTDDLEDYTTAYIASLIEDSIKFTKNFNCLACKLIFDENNKADESLFIRFKVQSRPCQSTFSICKQAGRFIKRELLAGSIDFSVIYREILENIDFESIYIETDFSSHIDHKIYLVRYIVNEYIRIKGTHIAKAESSKERENHLRSKLHKLVHYLGQ